MHHSAELGTGCRSTQRPPGNTNSLCRAEAILVQKVRHRLLDVERPCSAVMSTASHGLLPIKFDIQTGGIRRCTSLSYLGRGVELLLRVCIALDNKPTVRYTGGRMCIKGVNLLGRGDQSIQFCSTDSIHLIRARIATTATP